MHDINLYNYSGGKASLLEGRGMHPFATMVPTPLSLGTCKEAKSTQIPIYKSEQGDILVSDKQA